MENIERYIAEVQETLNRLSPKVISDVIGVLEYARANDRQVFVMGNGGSAATSSHFACDLGKGTIQSGRPRFRVIALTDNMPLFSAYANDMGYEHVFSEQLTSLLVERGDVVIGISGSGNSKNILKAVKLANSMGAITIGMTGFDGGRLKGVVDLCLHIPNSCMGQVEDAHLILVHLMCTCLREAPEGHYKAPPELVEVGTSAPRG